MENSTIVLNLVSLQTSAYVYALIAKKVVDLEQATLIISTLERRRLPEGSVMSFGVALSERRTAIYKGTVVELRILLMSWVREGEDQSSGVAHVE